ncbi:MAG TPA: YihY/virulence factor BrkB family protein [Bauldia sp.]|nr:YihY/virulence factor BrkB family protein [Bauldia sp.]
MGSGTMGRTLARLFSLPFLLAGGVGFVLGHALASTKARESRVGGNISNPKALEDKTSPDKPSGVRPGDVLRAVEPGRGREATSPLQIPWLGWKDIFWRTYQEFNDDRLMTIAAGVVFYVLLAIFPGMVVFISLYAIFLDPKTIGQLLATAEGIVPDEAFGLLQTEIMRIASKSTGALGITSLAALAVAVWSANSGTKSIFDALNIVYEESEKRSFVRLNLISLAFTLGAIVFLVVAAALVIGVPLVLGEWGLLDTGTIVLSLLRWPILFALLAGALSLLYRYGPSRNEAKWRWITPGSAFASLIWLIASLLFSFYLSNFADYTATYGSLGAVIGFAMWLWITFIAVLLGAELDAEIEHQTARDSTVGAAKPLGTRGATMADEVGVAKAE